MTSQVAWIRGAAAKLARPHAALHSAMQVSAPHLACRKVAPPRSRCQGSADYAVLGEDLAGRDAMEWGHYIGSVYWTSIARCRGARSHDQVRRSQGMTNQWFLDVDPRDSCWAVAGSHDSRRCSDFTFEAELARPWSWGEASSLTVDARRASAVAGHQGAREGPVLRHANSEQSGKLPTNRSRLARWHLNEECRTRALSTKSTDGDMLNDGGTTVGCRDPGSPVTSTDRW